MSKSIFVGRWMLGIGAGAIGQLFGLMTRLVLPPLFLKAWGVGTYGEWLMLTAIATHLSLTDLGGGTYVVSRMTQEFATGNLKAMRRSLNTGLFALTAVPLCVVVILTGVLWLFPLTTFLTVDHVGGGVAVIVIVLMMLQIAIAIPQAFVLGIFRAVGQLPRGSMLANVVTLLQLIVSAGALYFGASPIGLSVSLLLPPLLVGMAAIRILRREFPYLQVGIIRQISLPAAREMALPSLDFLSIQLSNAVSTQAIVFIVGEIIGPVAAVTFVTIKTLCNAMKVLLALVAHSAWPEITRLASLGQIGILVNVFQVIMRTSLLAAVAIIIILYLWGEPIYILWLGQKVHYDRQLMLLFLGFLLQQVFWNTCGHVLMATNNHRGLSLAMLVSALLSAALTFIVARSGFGLHGVAIAVLVAEVVVPLWAVPYLLFRFNPAFSFRKMSAEFIPACLVMALLLVHPWAGLTAAGAMCIWWATLAKQMVSPTWLQSRSA